MTESPTNSFVNLIFWMVLFIQPVVYLAHVILSIVSPSIIYYISLMIYLNVFFILLDILWGVHTCVFHEYVYMYPISCHYYNTLYSHLRGAWFKSWLGHQLSWDFRGFPQSLQEDARIVPWLGHSYHVSKPFQFISHPTVWCYSLYTYSTIE
jgi:hypothetical protein